MSSSGKIEHIVLNSSPLICLSKAGLTNLLPALFPDIVVPGAVIKELVQGHYKDTVLENTLSQLWIRKVHDVAMNRHVASWDLGDGESSVISYSLMNPKCWAVLDDRQARRCAESFGCAYIGTVGILVLARRNGAISSLREGISRLRSTGLWMSDSFIDAVCSREGE